MEWSDILNKTALFLIVSSIFFHVLHEKPNVMILILGILNMSKKWKEASHSYQNIFQWANVYAVPCS